MPEAATDIALPDAARYGEGCAAFYDQIYPPPAAAALRCLEALAGGGRVLDAGVGTGRYALPLAARGVDVHGLDASPAMLAALRAKPGGAALPLTLGDFASVSAPGRFALIFCLTDTLALLPAGRVPQALARFAAALEPHGSLLLETSYAPDHRSSELDVELDIQGGKRRYCATLQALAPAQLDTWAQACGLACTARWRDWQGHPWQGDSGRLLSLYQLEAQR